MISTGTWRHYCTTALTVWALCVVGAFSAKANDPRSAPTKAKETATKSSKEDWFARWVKGLHFAKYGKQAEEVRRVFRPAVHPASEATVEVLCDGQLKSLGLIVSADGYVVTKASQLAGTVACRLASGESYRAELVGSHRDNDLALLHIEADNLPVARWRRGNLPLVGSWVVAPGPAGEVLSVGIISTTSRWIRGGVLGVFLQETPQGAQIIGVNPKAGGGKAGLRRGDVILQVNGRDVPKIDDCIHAIGSYLPGDQVKLRILRNDETLEIEARLDSVHDSFESKRAKFQNSLGARLSERRAGFPSAFEHDLGLAPEQCGGPVVNLAGEVIGINIARSGRVTSLAIPANVVRTVVAEMKAGKWKPQAPLAARAEVATPFDTPQPVGHDSKQ